ncbi:hypothetical protein LINPERPRIM_LOCUS32138 [Linum perenne]
MEPHCLTSTTGQRCAGWVAQRYLAGAALAACQIVLFPYIFTHLATDGTYFF